MIITTFRIVLLRMETSTSHTSALSPSEVNHENMEQGTLDEENGEFILDNFDIGAECECTTIIRTDNASPTTEMESECEYGAKSPTSIATDALNELSLSTYKLNLDDPLIQKISKLKQITPENIQSILEEHPSNYKLKPKELAVLLSRSLVYGVGEDFLNALKQSSFSISGNQLTLMKELDNSQDEIENNDTSDLSGQSSNDLFTIDNKSSESSPTVELETSTAPPINTDNEIPIEIFVQYECERNMTVEMETSTVTTVHTFKEIPIAIWVKSECENNLTLEMETSTVEPINTVEEIPTAISVESEMETSTAPPIKIGTEIRKGILVGSECKRSLQQMNIYNDEDAKAIPKKKVRFFLPDSPSSVDESEPELISLAEEEESERELQVQWESINNECFLPEPDSSSLALDPNPTLKTTFTINDNLLLNSHNSKQTEEIVVNQNGAICSVILKNFMGITYCSVKPKQSGNTIHLDDSNASLNKTKILIGILLGIAYDYQIGNFKTICGVELKDIQNPNRKKPSIISIQMSSKSNQLSEYGKQFKIVRKIIYSSAEEKSKRSIFQIINNANKARNITIEDLLELLRKIGIKQEEALLYVIDQTTVEKVVGSPSLGYEFFKIVLEQRKRAHYESIGSTVSGSKDWPTLEWINMQMECGNDTKYKGNLLPWIVSQEFLKLERELVDEMSLSFRDFLRTQNYEGEMTVDSKTKRISLCILLPNSLLLTSKITPKIYSIIWDNLCQEVKLLIGMGLFLTFWKAMNDTTFFLLFDKPRVNWETDDDFPSPDTASRFLQDLIDEKKLVETNHQLFVLPFGFQNELE